DQPQFNKNGGDLHFGPDGMLYIAVGDGGGMDDEGAGHGTIGNGQNHWNALGVVLRIDVDPSPGQPLGATLQYGIPLDNPFFNFGIGFNELYAYGFQNPYRFSFDAVTGDLWLGDQGQNNIEEVDVVAGQGNYGWRLKEGT